jgi:crotonobetainyl-CoA:carnitine CoA-transferase CaiB-like acyl-CoA transferase
MVPSPPLAGIKVLEVGNYMAAPFCAMQLADLGADVVKVENPNGGDQVRSSAPLIDGEGSAFIRLNRNKRSLAVDLKKPEGKEVMLRLARSADVVIENLRPGTMRDLGLDYESLSGANRGLVYFSASGWGQDGPLRDQPGLDIMAQARSGLMSITGVPGGDPVKVGVPVCDLVCALYGALAIVSALYARRDSGVGQFIDVSLLEAGVSLGIWEAGGFFATGEIPKPLGSAHQSAAPYQAFRASDGWLTLGATTKPNWEAMCHALGLVPLIGEARFADGSKRHAHRAELEGIIEAVTKTKPVAHWLDVLERAGVPCAPIQDFGQSFNDPQLIERDFFWDAPHAKLPKVRQLGSPMRMSAAPARRTGAGPLLGQHTLEVLSEAGYHDDEVARLVGSHVVGTP